MVTYFALFGTKLDVNTIPNRRLTINPTVSNHGAQSHGSFF